MLSQRERERYQRQMLLFGEERQEILKTSSVLIAGAGGLGSPVAFYLAVAGVGRIRIVDNDRVERSNLNRQILHGECAVGISKTDSARAILEAMNPDISIDARTVTIDEQSVGSLFQDMDIIVDAMDNYPARYVLNRASLDTGIPLVHGAIHGFSGQATTFLPGRTACMRCLFRNPPPKEVFPVIGVTPGVIGLVQANEVLKYLLGTGTLLENRLLLWDGLSSTIEVLPYGKDTECEDCAGQTKRQG